MDQFKDERDGPTRWALRITNNRVNVPTAVVLYFNLMLSLFWFTKVVGGFGDDYDFPFFLLPFTASITAAAASVGGYISMAKGVKWLTSVSAVLGYLAWVLISLAWTFDVDRASNFTVPLFVVPMIIFFMHMHLRRVVENGKGG